MNDDVIEVADRLWRGELAVTSLHPVGYQGNPRRGPRRGRLHPVVRQCVGFQDTTTAWSSSTPAPRSWRPSIHEEIRRWTDRPPRHGHLLPRPHRPRVRSSSLRERGRRARMASSGRRRPRGPSARDSTGTSCTAGYNAVINRRQFQIPGLCSGRPTTGIRTAPTRTVSTCKSVESTFELHHAKGETDDHTWTWVPEHRDSLLRRPVHLGLAQLRATPRRSSAFPSEWAAALREMVELGPEVLLPGHGFPVIGADRVRIALTETAELLESLVEQTLALMNAGRPARRDPPHRRSSEAPPRASLPAHRSTTSPSSSSGTSGGSTAGGTTGTRPRSGSKPAPRRRALASLELAALAGQAQASRRWQDGLWRCWRAQAASAGTPGQRTARGGSSSGTAPDWLFSTELRLAGHLAELAVLADPVGSRDPPGPLRGLCADGGSRAPSTMAKGIYRWAATGSDYSEDSQAGSRLSRWQRCCGRSRLSSASCSNTSAPGTGSNYLAPRCVWLVSTR